MRSRLPSEPKAQIKRKSLKIVQEQVNELYSYELCFLLRLKSGDKILFYQKPDAKDQPILNAAIVSDVDIILTGDKDFLSLDIGWESERIGFIKGCVDAAAEQEI